MRSRARATAGTLKRSALAMAPDADIATATDAEPRDPRRLSDLLGFAYLATVGIVMTIWVGGLIWAAVAVVGWMVS